MLVLVPVVSDTVCGHDVVVAYLLAKQDDRVRFPVAALNSHEMRV